MGYYRSAVKLQRDRCLSEITSDPLLLATTIAHLGLTSVLSQFLVGSGITATDAVVQSASTSFIWGLDVSMGGGPTDLNGQCDIWLGNFNHLYFGTNFNGDLPASLPTGNGAIRCYFAYNRANGQGNYLCDTAWDCWSNTAATANTVHIRRSRGTITAASVVNNNDVLGKIGFSGNDGGGTWSLSSYMTSFTLEQFASNAHGADLRFFTTPAASTTPVQRLTISANAAAFTTGITSNHATQGVGYTTGAGTSATQSAGTLRTAAITLTARVNGQITTAGAVSGDNILAGVKTTFTVTSTGAIGASDNVIITKISGAVDTIGWVSNVASNTFSVTLWNTHASTTDATPFVFNFAVIKGSLT